MNRLSLVFAATLLMSFFGLVVERFDGYKPWVCMSTDSECPGLVTITTLDRKQPGPPGYEYATTHNTIVRIGFGSWCLTVIDDWRWYVFGRTTPWQRGETEK